MEDKNVFLTYKVHEYSNEEVSFREQIESNNLSPTIGDADKGSKSSNASFCAQVESNDVSYTIDDNTQGKNSSEVSVRKQLQTPSITYNTEVCISSEGHNSLNGGIRNLQSKGSDHDNTSYDEKKSKQGSSSRVVSHDKSDLENPLLIGIPPPWTSVFQLFSFLYDVMALRNLGLLITTDWSMFYPLCC